jgi:putative selenate reductase
VKLTNTLVVENEGDFLPSTEPAKYMSGAPLHVVAMHVLQRFRHEFGTEVPVSFSGGIDRINFPDAVALGLVPVTVCTDLLKPGGYARGQGYFRALARRMDAVGARTIAEFQPNDILKQTGAYVAGLAGQARYRRDYNDRPPRKVHSDLQLLDCLSCDKCIPACPNDANFTFVLADREAPHQIGNFADLCNDCGNCDVFCPEDGGPHRVKPRFFASGDVLLDRLDDDLMNEIRAAVLATPGTNYVNARSED